MWEYRTVTAPKANFKKLDEQLNVLGQEGWEAVGTVTAKKGNAGILLKRPVATTRRSATSRPRKQARARKATKRPTTRPTTRARKATKRSAATSRPKKQARVRKATKRPGRGRG